jgi:hypothetical protein
MRSESRLQVVGQEEMPDHPTTPPASSTASPHAAPPLAPSPEPTRGLAAFVTVLGFFLKLLTPRFAGLMVPVLALAGGFVLASQVVADPSHNQIALVAVVSAFGLLLVWLLQRRKS